MNGVVTRHDRLLALRLVNAAEVLFECVRWRTSEPDGSAATFRS
ncbi:MAG TPA: hypothetical protein VEZ11_10615 [Thermoanaerobaculia bacterium]|nr:hypothetical protein [Thermoanaerobaculia bacterium]